MKEKCKKESKKRAVVKSKRISTKEIHSKRTITEDKPWKNICSRKRTKKRECSKNTRKRQRTRANMQKQKKCENVNTKCQKIKKFFLKKIQKFQATVIKRGFKQRKQKKKGNPMR